MAKKLDVRVSEKGAISVYGLQRFPVTLYREQWETLLDEDNVMAILGCIEANGDDLATKADRDKRQAAAKAKAAEEAATVKRLLAMSPAERREAIAAMAD